MGTFVLLALLAGAGYLFVYKRFAGPDHSRYDQPFLDLRKLPDEISDQHLAVVGRVRRFARDSATTTAAARIQMDEFLHQEVDATIENTVCNGVPGEWVTTANSDPDKRLLYLHGGAFRVGSPLSHRYITSELARRAGVSVLAIDYRMQPEYKTIACHEDARTAYRWMLDNGPAGTDDVAGKVFVAGDSAGGNMTLALTAWVRDQPIQKIHGAIAMAPLADATYSSPSFRRNLATDPFLGPALGTFARIPPFLFAMFSSRNLGASPRSPEVSPLLGPLDGLPPTLLQVSNAEMLYDDAARYYNKAREAGSPVELQVWPTLVHVFQAFGPELPEAQDALSLQADFLKGC